MKERIILIIVCGIFSFYTSFSQEVKNKKQLSGNYVEQFSVLKDNKKVKHGQYLKYREGLLESKAIAIIGEYDQDKKIGTWYYFDQNGYLRMEGKYQEDKRQGLWKSYYGPQASNLVTLGQNNGIIFDNDGNFKIDRIRLITASEGVYHSGSKIGAWNYYSKNGSLLHKFDHSLKKLIVNNVSDSLNRLGPFLGGLDRFINEFYTIHSQLETGHPSAGSKLIVKIFTKIEPLPIEILESTGDKKFTKSIIEALKLMDLDYLQHFIGSEEGELNFKSEIRQEGNRYIFSSGFIFNE